jgi:hypothetical protein
MLAAATERECLQAQLAKVAAAASRTGLAMGDARAQNGNSYTGIAAMEEDADARRSSSRTRRPVAKLRAIVGNTAAADVDTASTAGGVDADMSVDGTDNPSAATNANKPSPKRRRNNGSGGGGGARKRSRTNSYTQNNATRASSNHTQLGTAFLSAHFDKNAF